MNINQDTKKQANKSLKYPELEINLSKIQNNAKTIVDKCNQKGISVCGIVKGANGFPEVAKALISGGCTEIGDSRLHHLMDLKKAGIEAPLLLTRIPMFSEIDDLVKYVDISLNSELEVIEEINRKAIRNNCNHKIILMCDLGDLREGIMNETELIKTAIYIENHLNNIELYGIGTNLGCYGSIKPTSTNLSFLVEIAEKIESNINRVLKVISGCATSTLPLVDNDEIPNRINHLRIGECILLGRDLNDLWNLDLGNLSMDTFLLNAEIVELKNKPSYPIGEIFLDAFGETPHYDDNGVRKRAIVAVGKQDFVYHDKLIPRDEDIKIIGSSSDHLILDLEDCVENYAIGDIISFEMFYAPMLYLSCSKGVYKRFV